MNNDRLAHHLAVGFGQRGKELFLVGGAVRDSLLTQGIDTLDLDFATSAHPELTFGILSDLPWFEPYRVGEKFGTISALVGQRVIEVTTYRAEQYTQGTRKPEVEFGTTLLDDLSRRDFTINAIARNPLNGELIDPFKGQRDLTLGLVRAVGVAGDRFRDDPLRLLRAVRFASRMGFAIEPGTWDAVRESSERLRSISRERIRDEMTRMLEGPRPSTALTLLRDSELLAHSVPELLELNRMKDHGPRHPLSLWDHTMRVVDMVPPRLVLRWSAILHDIAKPSTRTTEPDGRPRFFQHEELGAEMARSILTGLRYGNSVVEAVSLLVASHMQIHAYNAEWTDGAVRRLILRLGPMTEAALELAKADGSSHSPAGTSANEPKLRHLEERIRTLDRGKVHAMESPLSGHDLLQRFGQPPGPWIGRIKDTLKNEVLEGRLAADDRTSAWMLAERLMAEMD